MKALPTVKFYVRRWSDEQAKEGYVGPLPAGRALREAEAWLECGWSAEVLPATSEQRAIVNAWQKAANVRLGR